MTLESPDCSSHDHGSHEHGEMGQAAAAAAVDSDYLIDHSTVMYLMGPDGGYLAHFSHGSTADGIAQTLDRHIGG